MTAIVPAASDGGRRIKLTSGRELSPTNGISASASASVVNPLTAALDAMSALRVAGFEVRSPGPARADWLIGPWSGRCEGRRPLAVDSGMQR
jgi:hypothetical protein